MLGRRDEFDPLESSTPHQDRGVPDLVDPAGGVSLAMFVTIGYGDREGYDRTDPSVRDAAHAHDAQLHRSGAHMGIAGRPVQVRNHDDAGTETENGAFMSAPLPVAGFAVIEAANLEEAVEMVSRTPCAVAQGVVEVWPLQETL